MVTVTDVRLSSDNLSDARVYVTVAGDEEEHQISACGL